MAVVLAHVTKALTNTAFAVGVQAGLDVYTASAGENSVATEVYVKNLGATPAVIQLAVDIAGFVMTLEDSAFVEAGDTRKIHVSVPLNADFIFKARTAYGTSCTLYCTVNGVGI